MPGARRIRAKADGGQMQGGAPRVVWLTLGTDPRAVSVVSAAQRLRDEERPCHLVWDPVSGCIAQMLPVVRAACALGTREHIYYEPFFPGRTASAVNREGRMCVQIAVLASAGDPFTSYPMTRLGEILGWLDSWHIPRRWPAGQPAPFRQDEHRPRSRSLWARGGHFGASQVPGCTSMGPGCIDIDQLTGLPAVLPGPSPAVSPGMPASPASPDTVPVPAIRLDRRGVRIARELPLTAAGV
jgi:hypothetical protein